MKKKNKKSEINATSHERHYCGDGEKVRESGNINTLLSTCLDIWSLGVEVHALSMEEEEEEEEEKEEEKEKKGESQYRLNVGVIYFLSTC